MPVEIDSNIKLAEAAAGNKLKSTDFPDTKMLLEPRYSTISGMVSHLTV